MITPLPYNELPLQRRDIVELHLPAASFYITDLPPILSPPVQRRARPSPVVTHHSPEVTHHSRMVTHPLQQSVPALVLAPPEKHKTPPPPFLCKAALFAFWLRSSVVSVLFSLISETRLRSLQDYSYF
ncbi:hypothetical protein HBI52_113370 [Parastagonospora nodorum]|nr:hypothetical protein HBI79_114370 [Parastagonospora nodorum]KAH5514179.1 hypothetical protein HBI52_113370 [Parastagonospora nodorum]